MRRLAGFLAMSLLGCADPAADNHGWGWHYEFATPSGVRVRYEPGIRDEARAPADFFDASYVETAACVTGLRPQGPLVIIVPDGALPDGLGGQTFFDTGLILISETALATEVTSSDAVMIWSSLRHEFVHYLLMHQGLSDAEQATHAHPAFSACAGYVVT